MSSISEVAKRANVSITTVSRVLNGSSHPVNAETRKRVLEAARELNYSPSALAQAMITGSTQIVAVLVGDSMDPYFASIVRGIEDVGRKNGYLVIVCNTDRLPDIEVQYLQTLNNYRVDGVIFAGGGLTDDEYLEAMELPLAQFKERDAVIVTLGDHRFPSLSVVIDNERAAFDATAYLIKLGHKEITYISGPEQLTTSGSRLRGYRRALEEHGLPFRSELVLPGDFTFESGLEAAEIIAQKPERITAVVASNDLIAIGCMHGLKRNGLQIPQDVSVIGIDNITAARFTDPPLSTIAVPLYDLGAVGMERLLTARSGEALEDGRTVLPHELVKRDSAAAPSHLSDRQSSGGERRG